MNEREEVNKIITLVVVGYDVNGGAESFKKEVENKSFFTDNGYKPKECVAIKTPTGDSFPIAYANKNEELLQFEYRFMERKLLVTLSNYRENNSNPDSKIQSILKSLLTIAPSSQLQAFGINYNTDIQQEKKLCLFNALIENKLDKAFWDTNTGFKTEIAFKSNDYTSMYRIYKNENLSKDNLRYYTFDANFNFELQSDDKAAQILEIFMKNNDYYDIYTDKIGKILEL